jgi:hypothetical protein
VTVTNLVSSFSLLHIDRSYEDADFVEEDEDSGFEASGSCATNRYTKSHWGGAGDQVQDTSYDGNWGTPIKAPAAPAGNDWGTPKGPVSSSSCDLSTARPAQVPATGGNWGAPAAKTQTNQDTWTAAANW